MGPLDTVSLHHSEILELYLKTSGKRAAKSGAPETQKINIVYLILPRRGMLCRVGNPPKFPTTHMSRSKIEYLFCNPEAKMQRGRPFS